MFLKKFIREFFRPVFNQQGSFSTEEAYDMSEYIDGGENSGEVEGETEVKQPEGQVETEEQSIEQQLDSIEIEKGDDVESLIDKVNALGFIRNGLPFEIESDDQLREFVMKGYDYTQKTQEFSNERKQIETELTEQTNELDRRYAEFEEEKAKLNDVVYENQVFGGILEQLKMTHPDAYEEIQLAFNQSMGMYKNTLNNPVFKSQQQRIDQLERQLLGQQNSKVDEEAGRIMSEWENGLRDTQTQLAPKLKSLGVKVNWGDVQKMWSSDQSKTMTVKGALFAVYGEKIQKAMESREKLNTTKAKSVARQKMATQQTSNQNHDNVKPLFREQEYDQAINEIINSRF